jgi:hypothetical protein
MRKLLAALLWLVATPAFADKPLAVAGIEARLFYNHSGTLSKPVGPKTELWNAVIGEGGIAEPSNSTFIVVLVQGEPGSYEPKARVDQAVTDQSTGKLLQSHSAEVGVLNVEGKYRVGFWIPKTGCVPLRLRATVAGSKAAKTLTLPFACGE